MNRITDILKQLNEQKLTSDKAFKFIIELEYVVLAVIKEIEMADVKDRSDTINNRDSSNRKKAYKSVRVDIEASLKNLKNKANDLKPHLGIYLKKIQDMLENISGTLAGFREDTFHKSINDLQELLVRTKRMLYTTSIDNRKNLPTKPKKNLLNIIKRRKRDDT